MQGIAKQQERLGRRDRSSCSAPSLYRWSIERSILSCGMDNGRPGTGRREGQGWYTGRTGGGEVPAEAGGGEEERSRAGR